MKGMIRDELSTYASFPWLDKMPQLDEKWLYAAISLQRSIKSDEEMVQMKHIAKISADAHKYVMRKCQPNITEFKLRELFKLYCGLNGAPHEAYGSICGCGPNAAILHYIVNSKVLGDGKLVLSDMGARGNGYTADITCTYPINGKFTQKQREIYTLCLEANLEAAKYLKPGVVFSEAHKAAARKIVEGLIELGLITTDIETATQKKLASCFFPHGLGHYLGLYVHDVGICTFKDSEGKETDLPRSQGIGTRVLEKGVVCTNEPGIYFIPLMINKYKNDPETTSLFNWDKVEEYIEVGGVRIEDDLVITDDGHEVYHDLPRTCDEIEAWMAGKDYK